LHRAISQLFVVCLRNRLARSREVRFGPGSPPASIGEKFAPPPAARHVMRWARVRAVATVCLRRPRIAANLPSGKLSALAAGCGNHAANIPFHHSQYVITVNTETLGSAWIALFTNQ
jgi:hypothetical protein